MEWLATGGSPGADDGVDKTFANLEPVCLPVSRWSRVSVDDTHLTHLVNLFFTWDNTLSRLINRDVFLETMKTGRPKDANTKDDDSREYLCSPFLINALLALGCVCNPFAPSCSQTLTSLAALLYRRARFGRSWQQGD